MGLNYGCAKSLAKIQYMHNHRKLMDFKQKKLLDQLADVEKTINYQFQSKAILLEVFIHKSALNEQADLSFSNERLEYLGDAALELIVREYLLLKYPKSSEGTLSEIAIRLVEQEACKCYAQKLNLEPFLIVGAGARNLAEGKVLANLFEALIGGIFLDGGYAIAKSFFLGHFACDLEAAVKDPIRDPKTTLQELLQKKHKERPEYRLLDETGPGHARLFTVGVYFAGELLAKGEGRSKREAEKAAAKEALSRHGVVNKFIWKTD